MELKPTSRRFKWRARFFAAAATLTLLADSAAAADDPEPQTLDEVIEEITTLLRDSNTPGTSLAIVTKDEVLFAGGLGVADVAQQTPATADTRFRIGSISKGFTALAALKLQAEGRLDLDATLASLAPEIEFENRWEANDPVRIVHLLEHTSGFEDIHLRDFANNDPRPHNLRDALAYDPDSRRSRWRPGTRFAYCNSGPGIVAYVVEQITGEVFEDYVRREFFTPIGMTTATYFPPDDGNNLTELYEEDGVTPFPYWHISMRPAGSINASAKDMAAYVRFLLNRGRVREQVIVSEADILRMERPMTTIAARAGLESGYGLYNHTSEDEDGRVWHGHSGGMPGGVAALRYLPEVGVGYAIIINSGDIEILQQGRKMLERFLTRNLSPPEHPAVVAIAEDFVATHSGHYVPTNPRHKPLGVAARIFQVGHLSFANGEARFGETLGGFLDHRQYVGVTPTVLRRKGRSAASLALIEPSQTDSTRLASGMVSYRRLPAVVAFAPLVLVGVSAVMALSTVVLVPVWFVRRLPGKIRRRKHAGLRFWPLASSLVLLWYVGSFLAIFRDEHVFQHYGNITLRSAGLAASSVAVLVVAIGGLVAIWRARRFAPHRGLYAHALLVQLTLSVLTLFLAFSGVIPLVTWG